MAMYPTPVLRATPQTLPEPDPLIVGIDADQLERLRDHAREAGWRACRLANETDGDLRRGLYTLARDLAGLALALERRLPEHAPTLSDRVSNLPVNTSGK